MLQDRSIASLKSAAYRIRRYALQMGAVQGQGYIGQALGMADILAVAYRHALNYHPAEPEWEGRDRFLLSHGHYAIALYAALIEAGIVPEPELETYGSDDSRLPMSGMATYTPGMEISGGSLGQGLAIGVGMALGRRIDVGSRSCCQPPSLGQPHQSCRHQQPAGGRALGKDSWL
jgi:transketolase